MIKFFLWNVLQQNKRIAFQELLFRKMRFLEEAPKAIPSGIDDSYTSHRQRLPLQTFQNFDQPLSRLEGWNYRVHRQATRFIFVQNRCSLFFLPLSQAVLPDFSPVSTIFRSFRLSVLYHRWHSQHAARRNGPLLRGCMDKKGERTTGSPPLDLAASAHLSMITVIRFFSPDQA